jgi:hypothetical protein
VDVPSPRSRLGPAGPAVGALFGGVSKRPESAESIHVCGVDGPSLRIDLAPPQPLRTRGHFLQRTRPGSNGRACQGELQQPLRISDDRPGHDEIGPPSSFAVASFANSDRVLGSSGC